MSSSDFPGERATFVLKMPAPHHNLLVGGNAVDALERDERQYLVEELARPGLVVRVELVPYADVQIGDL